MKKTLLVTVFACLALASASATQFWYDAITSYPAGCITTNTANWFPHLPGVLAANDMLITPRTYTSGTATSGNRLVVNGLNSEYIMRLFDPNYPVTTNIIYNGAVYASFVVAASYVPGAGQGTYFACFNSADTNTPPLSVTDGFDFRGRVYEIGNTNVFPYTNTVPYTWRLGIANAAGDPAQPTPGPTAYVPIDLAKNVDYQVVLKYDIDAASASIWVNPASESDTANWSGPTSDFGLVNYGLAGLLFRQRTGGGTVDIRDVVVGDTFADVMTNTPSPVLVATNFNTVTNYTGNPGLLEVFATSIGGGPLTYQWYKMAGATPTAVPGANSQALLINSLQGSDQGYYFCAITNSANLGAVSQTNFYISVNATPTPPGFTREPVSASATIAGQVTLSCTAYGTGPLSFQWKFNGNPLTDGAPATSQPGDLSVVSGAQTPTLTITGLSTNETGNYTVTVTGAVAPAATSSNAVVTVNPARLVNIAYLRSLLDTNTWMPSDTTSIFTISNAVITTYTNTTSGSTASYYIEDGTGGLNLFVTGDASFRPLMGDLVSVSGTLSSYNNNLEIIINSLDPYQFYGITGHTNLLPAPIGFNLDFLNNPGLMETNFEGRLVILTNVAFDANFTTGTTGGSGNTYVTNLTGGGASFNVYLPAFVDLDVQNRTLPPAGQPVWSITGVLAHYSTRYELYVTRFGDILTDPPPAVTVTATISGNDVILNWTAVPYTTDTLGSYAYTVYAATDVAGPYLPLASGLGFNASNGTYTDKNALLGPQKFYRVSSP